MQLPDFMRRITNDGLRGRFSDGIDSGSTPPVSMGKRSLRQPLGLAIDQNVNGVAEKHDKQGVSGLFRL